MSEDWAKVLARYSNHGGTDECCEIKTYLMRAVGELVEERTVRRQLAEALRAEQRAARLCAYGESLPDGVTTEAFAEAANLRRGSAAALAAHDALDDGT